jgi:hypothetical protein
MARRQTRLEGGGLLVQSILADILWQQDEPT